MRPNYMHMETEDPQTGTDCGCPQHGRLICAAYASSILRARNVHKPGLDS